MKSALVMVSGGCDSATALFVTAKSFKPRAVFFDIGQMSADFELTAARQVCRAADVPLEVVDLSGMKHFFLGLVNRPELAIGFYGGIVAESAGPNCPHGLFGVASTYCVSAGIDVLVTGMHAEDKPGAAAMKEYLQTWGAAIRKLQPTQFDFSFPLLDMGKADVLKLGEESGVPLHLTRSCTRPTWRHCGTCPACTERRQAFKLAGVTDRTEYEA
ncbi:7-cyano-7-deazaguanine synthase [Ramlibacter alkalitolerans]|uniref:7-cyano-7-deazaguanine synthase n=1 Tax=Ramlibacter alkalitolerans TaxID=2039631 RepID=A0ABS1JU98_9BURK|nr:7-cyano-7-deazaguanine synthase [Ramlibacter alkalitolerans]MBL0427839.1 7-cyano-7-deazaguanine synthase [Ramlibacter alkalitolerans]